MSQPQSTPSIVVGIDGSSAATNAAKWTAVEAGGRCGQADGSRWPRMTYPVGPVTRSVPDQGGCSVLVVRD